VKENLFVNKYDKEFKNNNTVFYSKNPEYREQKEHYEVREVVDVRKKLNEIFNAPDFVYKADVLIFLKDKKVEKTIIAKNASSIITLDNETIRINDIVDIKKVVK